MSAGNRDRDATDRTASISDSGAGNWTSLLFGDDTGLALFLGALCVTWFTWQVGIFITDTYAVANTLVNVAGGHLSLDRIEYSLTLGSQPGLHVVDGRLYGRNYGQAFLSLPVYYGLELAGAVVDLRLVIPGVWSLLVLAFARQVGVVTGRRRIVLAAGSVLATVLFLANVALATPIEGDLTGILALQLVSTAAVAATALLLYRTLGCHYDRRTAIAGGVGVVVATPLWFWAPVPKRHVLTGAAVAALLFVFASSRVDESSRGIRLRALGYVVAGFVAWVHVFEGVALLVAYGTADLATAPKTGRRELLALILALSIAFAPFVATNVLVSGNPAEPPRLTPSFSPHSEQGVELGPGGSVVRTDGSDRSDDAGGTTGSGSGPTDGSDTTGGSDATGGSDTADGSDTGDSGGAQITDVLGRTVRQGGSYVGRTVAAVGTAPTRLYHTYVRSGNLDLGWGEQVNQHEAIDLTLLESVPVFGTLIAGLGLGVRRVRHVSVGGWREPDLSELTALRTVREHVRTAHPATQTAALAALIAVGFGVMYFSYLPLHSQITVRYLLPTVPALWYLLARLSPLRRAVRERTRTLVASYLVSVLAGGALVVLGFPWLDPAIGEAMQLHTLVNLGAAAAAAALVAGYAPRSPIDERLLAVGLALPAAGTTLLIGFMQLDYFGYGTYAIPLARLVADGLVLVP